MKFHASHQLRSELVRAADAQTETRVLPSVSVRGRRALGWLCGALVVVGLPAGAAATGVISTNLFDASPRELAHVVQDDQREAFGVFARARVAQDVVPGDVASMIGDSKLSGRNLSLSRAIRTPTGRGWAFPGNRAVCLAVPDPTDGFGVTCANTSFAASFGLAAMLASPNRPGDVDLTLLLPEGATASVRLADGSSGPLIADSEGVVAVSLSKATEIDIVSPSGERRRTAMPVPPPASDALIDCGQDRVVPARQGCPRP